MDLTAIGAFIERLRKELIGDPVWLAETRVYQYERQSIVEVAVLKLARAVHGLSAMEALRQGGHVIDLGATIRSVNDSIEEVYFLFETYPEAPSGQVEKFTKAFFESTIDGYLEAETHQVQRQKIRSAVVRVLKNGERDAKTQALLERIYKTFCGYVHADYAHIMEVYNGQTHDFNLVGVPDKEQKDKWQPYIALTANSILFAAAFLTQKLERKDLYDACMKLTT